MTRTSATSVPAHGVSPGASGVEVLGGGAGPVLGSTLVGGLAFTGTGFAAGFGFGATFGGAGGGAGTGAAATVAARGAATNSTL